jgi:hypothetical protein
MRDYLPDIVMLLRKLLKLMKRLLKLKCINYIKNYYYSTGIIMKEVFSGRIGLKIEDYFLS